MINKKCIPELVDKLNSRISLISLSDLLTVVIGTTAYKTNKSFRQTIDAMIKEVRRRLSGS